MRKPKNNGVLKVLTTISALFLADCNGQNSHVVDITTQRQFGCRWLGGTAASVYCNCTEDVEELLIQPQSIPSFDTSTIVITGCPKVRFASNSVTAMRNLRTISLNDIPSLHFEEKSLNWYGYKDVNGGHEERFDLSIPSLKILLKNCHVTQISTQTFSGRINEVNLEDVTVGNIAPFAFSKLMQSEKIIFNNVAIDDIKMQAFKGFGTEIIQLYSVRAPTLPSRTFSDVKVYEQFSIFNCSFDRVYPGAFSIFNPSSVQISYTNISRVDGEAFKITTRGDVYFRNNFFSIVNNEAFAAIRINREEVSSARTLTFEGNTFTDLDRNSLRVRDFDVRYVNLNINETCDCNSIFHNLKETEFYSEIRCYFVNEYVTVREFRSNMCSILTGYYTVIIVVCVIVLLLGLIAIGLFIYYKLVYRSSKYGSEKASKNQKGTLSLIVPDGRTYKETELHVIVEKADLLTTDL